MIPKITLQINYPTVGQLFHFIRFTEIVSVKEYSKSCLESSVNQIIFFLQIQYTFAFFESQQNKFKNTIAV